jgi:3-methylfumaryl-CoA hydratase
MTLDLSHLQTWIGRSESLTEVIAPFPSNALAATLDRADPPHEAGTPLPPLWHWLHFLPLSPLAEAGPDGHPARGGFLPPVPLPRRMWAGSRLNFLAPLRIGADATKTSTVKSVTMKEGRTGPLVFVTVRHVVTAEGATAIEEEHDIVYRENAPAGAAPPAPPQAPGHADFERLIMPDPVLLFRYSALTFNSHRIHFDQPYVTGVEGYPGLIVHGPLIATLLLDNLRRAHPDRKVKAFSFRAVSPLFDISPFSVCGALAQDGLSAQLWACRTDGGLAMEATAALA